MERLSDLISKLNEEFAQKADPSQLLQTTQLIEAEILRLSSYRQKALNTTKVSVVMPSAVKLSPPEPNGSSKKSPAPPEPQPAAKNGNYLPAEKPGANGLPYNPMTEIPTLAHQVSNKEVNELLGTPEYSLNDKLKENVREIGHALTDVPIRDLKKAIGINDRFVFISELFRGDEPMYERSIKTINGFRIFAEAEYWIERELKIKLGWDDSKEYTQHFYKLVKRRFS